MSDTTSRLPARPSLEQLRKQAKDLLRQYRTGDPSARIRFEAVRGRSPASGHATPSLTDAQFVLARELGFDNWTSLKRHVEQAWKSRLEPYEKFAEDLCSVLQTGDADALERVHEGLGRSPSVEQIRQHVLQRLSRIPGRVSEAADFSLADARLFVARLYSFETWNDLEMSVSQPASERAPAVHGLSAGPPFYRIRWKDHSIEPRPPLSIRDWDEIFDVMRTNGIGSLHAAGQMTDSALERLAELDLVTALDLEGSGRVTDEGMKHLAGMSRLERLNLTGCDITDKGLGALRQIPALREFYLYHHGGVTDAGLANLAFSDRLERVDLLGCTAGNGVIRALAGKPTLRHFKSGNLVTDAALPMLHDFPVFKSWQGAEPNITLMDFGAGPNFLLLRGQITNAGLGHLVGLDGLFALNLDDSRLAITAAGLKPLAALPHLQWLGIDANDETMGAIAALPHLRMLMCQDTSTGDNGFTDLSRSRTLEYIWGRRCYNLTGRGFDALASMPALRGLSVSCKNVDDAALAALPRFPALREFMPMDFQDESFRHVGRCESLEAVWCMYCRDTGDAATGHIAGLKHLKTYYAGSSRITDRSLEILSGMGSLEHLTFSACLGVSNAGIRMLAALPHLRELSLEYMPGLTRQALASIPDRIRVNFET
jgi:hypothetical protein